MNSLSRKKKMLQLLALLEADLVQLRPNFVESQLCRVPTLSTGSKAFTALACQGEEKEMSSLLTAKENQENCVFLHEV
jgi:hypothetical protein